MTDDILKHVGKRLGNLASLPKELRDQLQDQGPDELSSRIMAIIKIDFQGVANLDEILVGLYKRSGEIHRRPFITTKMHKMIKEGLVEPVQNKKGIYKVIR